MPRSSSGQLAQRWGWSYVISQRPAGSESRRPRMRPRTNQRPPGGPEPMACASARGPFQTEGCRGGREAGGRGGRDRGAPPTRNCRPLAGRGRRQAGTGSRGQRTGPFAAGRRVALFPPAGNGTSQDGRRAQRRGPGGGSAPDSPHARHHVVPSGPPRFRPEAEAGRPSVHTQWFGPCRRHRLGRGSFPEPKFLWWMPS